MERILLDCFPNCNIRKEGRRHQLKDSSVAGMGLINASLAEGYCPGYDPDKPYVCNNSRSDSAEDLLLAAEKFRAAEDAYGFAAKEIEQFRKGKALLSFIFQRDIIAEVKYVPLAEV